MLVILLQFAVFAAVIVAAGVGLTMTSDRLGDRLGMDRSLTGMILVAAATSLPELSVSVSAAKLGATDMAVGNMVGSCVFNLMILAGLDLVLRSRGRMFTPSSAQHALSGLVSMGMMALLITLLVADVDWSVPRISAGSVMIMAAYFGSIAMIYREQQAAEPMIDPESGPESAVKKNSILPAAAGYVACVLVILLAAPHLADASDQLAAVTGLGGTFVGSVFVAIATSLPELTASVQAVRMKAHDLAVGNIIGSNCFNIMVIALSDLFVPQKLIPASSSEHVLTLGAAVAATSVACASFIYRGPRGSPATEPSAAMVMLIGVGSLIMLYFAG